jgi:CheY-like chemotaxis protein
MLLVEWETHSSSLIPFLVERVMTNTRARLLIVDDEPVIRTVLSQVLTEIGYSVRSAEDGFAALREIGKEVPDLLLSDLNMPGMSGFELLSVVRRCFPVIRTIAMSGAFSGDEVPSGVASDAFYQKGGSIRSLLRIMETMPELARPAHPPSRPEAYATVTCPECLRSFAHALGTGCLKSNFVCVYCCSSIDYAIVQPTDRMPLPVAQNRTASATPFQPSSTSPSY